MADWSCSWRARYHYGDSLGQLASKGSGTIHRRNHLWKRVVYGDSHFNLLEISWKLAPVGSPLDFSYYRCDLHSYVL